MSRGQIHLGEASEVGGSKGVATVHQFFANHASAMDDLDDTLTNLLRPPSAATMTVRVIKSFQYRVAKALVIRELDLNKTSVGDLKKRVQQRECTCKKTVSGVYRQY